jgi:O-antigen/teichoic acid export membrane protein
LHNGYELSDRYLLIWMSGLGASEIQAAAGQLHSAKVLPGLLVNVAAMLSGMLLPFVSASLVRGEPEKACRQLNWTLKLSGLVLVGVNFAILSFAPWLFNFFLRGKYGAGLELLPLATVACSWFSLLTISQDWLWARERGRFAVFSLVLGLGVTLLSGWLLIPVNAAWGAVTATILGNLTALLAILVFNHVTGCSHDLGVWLALTFPLAVLGGPLATAAAAIIVLYLLSSTEWYFDAGEREEVEQRMLSLLQRFRRG